MKKSISGRGYDPVFIGDVYDLIRLADLTAPARDELVLGLKVRTEFMKHWPASSDIGFNPCC
jgi:hypothetical protein